jgi:hypothetical protein
MLWAYGAGGTLKAPIARLLLRPFTWYTRHVYARLARSVAHDILDYQRSGIDVTGLVGIGGSPSCGVQTTLDLPAAVSALTRCPAARLDRRTLNEGILAANVCPGEGLFIHALRQRLTPTGAHVPMLEHDLLAELEIHPPPGAPPGTGAADERDWLASGRAARANARAGAVSDVAPRALGP